MMTPEQMKPQGFHHHYLQHVHMSEPAQGSTTAPQNNGLRLVLIVYVIRFSLIGGYIN